MLLYSLLHLTGYKNISLNDIKNFRQLNSICAGHPEFKKDSGIDLRSDKLALPWKFSRACCWRRNI